MIGKQKIVKQSVQGVSLIEVLVSVLILSVGLLGIAAMQAITLGNTQSSTERTQAVIHSYSILDAMRANAVDARAGNYNLANVCVAPAIATLATSDLNFWMTNLRATNQNACATIACVAVTNNCSVTVTWNDARATGGNANHSIVTVGSL